MASPGRPRKTDIDAWKKKAEAFGIPLDELIAALRDEVVSAAIRQPVDLEALSLKVAEQLKATLPIVGPGEIERVQAALSGDLGENIKVVSVKLEELVSGVRTQLKAQVDAIESTIPQRLNQAVSEAAPGIIEAVVQRLEAKFGGQAGARPAASGGQQPMSSFLSAVMQAPPEFWTLLAKLFGGVGQQQTDMKTLLTGMRLGNALKTGQVSVDELEKAVTPPAK